MTPRPELRFEALSPKSLEMTRILQAPGPRERVSRVASNLYQRKKECYSKNVPYIHSNQCRQSANNERNQYSPLKFYHSPPGIEINQPAQPPPESNAFNHGLRVQKSSAWNTGTTAPVPGTLYSGQKTVGTFPFSQKPEIPMISIPSALLSPPPLIQAFTRSSSTLQYESLSLPPTPQPSQTPQIPSFLLSPSSPVPSTSNGKKKTKI